MQRPIADRVELVVARDGADLLTQALYFEATAKLTGDMLVKVDRMSMANSLEVRCPLLDHRVVERAFAIPRREKLRHLEPKSVLRRIARQRLPEEVLDLDLDAAGLGRVAGDDDLRERTRTDVARGVHRARKG